MIKLKEQCRVGVRHALRRGLGLLCLLAAILALSQTSNAYNEGKVKGTWSNITSNNWSDWSFQDMNNSNNTTFSFSFTPTKSGTLNFVITLNGEDFGPYNNDDAVPNSRPSSNNGRRGGNSFSYTVSSSDINKTHTIYCYNAGGNNYEPAWVWMTVANNTPDKLYLRGEFPQAGNSEWYSNWNTGVEMKNGNTNYEYVFGTVTSDKTANFKLVSNQSGWDNSMVNLGVESSNAKVGSDDVYKFPANGGSVDLYNDGGSKNIAIDLKPNKTYKITWSGTVPGTLTLTVTDNGTQGGDTSTQPTGPVSFYYVITDGKDAGIDMTNGGDSRYYYTEFSVPTSGKYWVAVKDDTHKNDFGGNGWIGAQNGHQDIDFDYNGVAPYDDCAAYGSNPTRIGLNLKEGERYKVEYWPFNNVNDKNYIRIYITRIDSYSDKESLPVYPLGTYTEDDLKNYNEPTYYLLGEILNHERVTPEYQFKKVSEDEYVLEFTLRNTDGRWIQNNDNWQSYPMKIVKYATPDSPQVDEKTNITYSGLNRNSSSIRDISGTNSDFLGGVKATFTYHPSNKTLEQSINLEKDKLPFISLIGANWQQRKVYSTHNSYPDNNKNLIAQTTAKGWEEAWIQYDDKGNVAFDRNGKVMYNTNWPPKNPITFKTEFKLNENDSEALDFSVVSTDLVFKPVAVKKGSAWKADTETFKDLKSGKITTGELTGNSGLLEETKRSDNDKDGHDYAFTCPNDENDFDHKLVLDDDEDYRLYEVENVWINGKFKFWTGWSGGYNNTGGAGWTNHANWGHFKKQVADDPAQKIRALSTVPLDNVDGDMVFAEPTFFSKIYFFYNVNHGQEARRNVFLTEIAEGGAEIAALNSTDYKYGYFRPGLTSLANMFNGLVKKVDIDCWTSDRKENMGNVWSWKYKDGMAKVENKDFHTIFNRTGDSTYPDLGSASSGNYFSKTKWLHDSNVYPNGEYRYVMTITITTDNDGVNEETITVVSNPFIIYDPNITTVLTAFQLVEDLTTQATNDYVTFRTDSNGNPYEPYYKVVDNADGSITFTTLSDEPDFADGNKYKFTDKVLLRSNTPSVSKVNGYTLSYTDANGNAVSDGITENNGGLQTSGRYMKIVTPKELKELKYTLGMNYLDRVPGTSDDVPGTSVPGENIFALTVPTPKVNKAQVEVTFGNANSTDRSDHTMNFTFNGKKKTGMILDKARYQSVREVLELEAPNATDALSGKMDVFKYYSMVGDYGTPNTQVSTDNIVLNKNGNLWTAAGKFVEPSSLFSKDNKGQYDEKTVHWALLDAYKNVNVFDRWGDGRITSIDMTDDAPIKEEEKKTYGVMQVKDKWFFYGNGGNDNLVEKFQLYIQLDATNFNYIQHEDKDVDDDELTHGDSSGSKNEDSAGNNNANDYYYVSIHDLSKPIKNDAGEIEDYEVALLDNTKGEVNDNYAEFVLRIEDLDSKHNSATGGKGYLVDFYHRYDQGWYAEQLADAVSNPWFKNLQVRISYLYPFNTKNPSNVREGMSRVESDFSGDVVKSQANVWNVDGEFDDDETPTGVEGIGAESFSVKAGVGFIEVAGRGVEIYNAQGVQVAAGEGRYEVGAGVYVVRVNGRTQKVIVR